MRTIVSVLVAVVVAVSSAQLWAQSAEQDIRKLNDTLAALDQKGDKAAYAPLVADDLRWVNNDGSVWGKSDRVAAVVGNNAGRTFRDADIKVYGDFAVMIVRGDFKSADGKSHVNRVLRVFTKRTGQWQLLNHAAVEIPVTTK